MNLIILPRISIYCCNAMQQRYKHSVISAFLWMLLIFLIHSSRIQGLFLLKCDWVVSRFRAQHTATWGFTSQFPEEESNNGEEAEATHLLLLRNIRRSAAEKTKSHSEPAVCSQKHLGVEVGGAGCLDRNFSILNRWKKCDWYLHLPPLRTHCCVFRNDFFEFNVSHIKQK